MALLPSVFRAQDHDSMDDFSPIPAGEYITQIVKSEVKDTKAGNGGKRLVLQEKVMEGDYAGRLVFVGLNIVNQNPVAMEIANKELKSICEACGKGNHELQDSAELHMIPHKITVAIKPADANWPEQNIVKKYEALEGTAAASAKDSNPFAEED